MYVCVLLAEFFAYFSACGGWRGADARSLVKFNTRPSIWESSAALSCISKRDLVSYTQKATKNQRKREKKENIQDEFSGDFFFM